MSTQKKLITLCFATVFTLGLAACGSNGNNDTAEAPVIMPEPVTMPEPMPYEMALTGIAAADTAAAAQAAYDAVKDDVTASEGEDLQDAVDTRTAALATMARAAMQSAALMTAAGGVDTSGLMTQADIDTAQTAIDALKGAIAAAADVADTSMYQSQVDTAEMAVATAQGNVDTQGRMASQTTALMDASMKLQTALGALSGAPTQAEIDAVTTALAELNMAIADAADLDDTASYELAAANAQGQIDTAKKTLMANMDREQTEADRIKAEEEAARLKGEAEVAAALAATAAKLHPGITPHDGQENVRTAAYVADNIVVTIDTAAVTLSEDKTAMVGARHGWTGMRFTADPGDGTYEAVVYSHVGEATEGVMFSAMYMYDARTVDSAFTELMIDAGDAARVDSPSFDKPAGKKEFDLPDDNTERVRFPGTYHGVSGIYNCTPDAAMKCSAAVATSGFTLAGGTWTFKATNPESRLMNTPDDEYASYGWWLNKAADGGAFTAGAFHDYKGDDDAPAVNIEALRGTATYMGGAAGKYALSSSTGGKNDAGHFAADATLKAKFAEEHTISGTIDNFTGADGEARDWSVELKPAAITDQGMISRTADLNDTVWTIGETAGAASGEWSGNLREGVVDDVPAIATGTFYSEYGLGGKMIGAFGANKQ